MKHMILIAIAMIGMSLTAHEGMAEDQLKLNDGAKWTANQATHDGMKAIDHILASKPDQMVEQLQKELQGITSQCTMTGEAHDQLHHVLIPIIENTNALQTTTDEKTRTKHITRLKALTKAYFKYFKL